MLAIHSTFQHRLHIFKRNVALDEALLNLIVIATQCCSLCLSNYIHAEHNFSSRGSRHSRHQGSRREIRGGHCLCLLWMALGHSKSWAPSRHSRARHHHPHRAHPKSSSRAVMVQSGSSGLAQRDHCVSHQSPFDSFDQATRANSGLSMPFCHFCQAEKRRFGDP